MKGSTQESDPNDVECEASNRLRGDAGVWSLSPACEVLLVVVASSCVKLLAATAPMLYYSTDLEVHRHWMSTVWQHRLEEWLPASGSCSLWSIDYPPLFAWFEYLCAAVAHALIIALSLATGVSTSDSLEIALSDTAMPLAPAGERAQVELQRMLQMQCSDAEHTMPEHSYETVTFMRCTVIGADLVLALAVILYVTPPSTSTHWHHLLLNMLM